MTKIHLNGVISFLLILVFTGLIYSNTFNSSWHFDDFGNIFQNPKLHISDLSPASLLNSMKASINGGYYNGKSFYRPVTMLSFAINWYFGKSDVWGYHFVNTVIHVISALFLYLATFHLFKTKNLKKRYSDKAYSIALFSTIIWVIHPIQSQGVTYIVQRMASMAAMFYIISIYCYLKARLATSTRERLLFYFLLLLNGLLAVGCKENAALLPLAIFLMEVIFFHKLEQISFQRKMFFALGGVFGILFIIGAAFVFYKNPFGFLGGYANRPFTLWERLLTESRIVILYFKQIFYPVASNYSIVHDIKISTNLFSPWTTFPSVIAIASLLSIGVANIKKRPLVSFAILFYFVNHIVESTILPLELIFEHRNYLPSMFLFLPVAVGLNNVLNFYREKNQLIFSLIAIGTSVFLFLTGFATYTRNFDWQSEETLWKAAIQTAPGNPRGYQNLASLYYQRKGMYDISIALNQKALTLEDKNPEYSKMVSYDNLQFNYMQKKEFKKAVYYGQKAVEAYPDSNNARYSYIVSLLSVNRLEEAEKQVDILIDEKKRPDIIYLYMKVHILLKMGRAPEAKPYILKAFKAAPLSPKSRLYLGIYHFKVHNYERANQYISLALDGITPDDQLFLYFLLIENAEKAHRKDMQVHYMRKILKKYTLPVIVLEIRELEKDMFPLVSLSFESLEKNLKLAITTVIYSSTKQGL